MQRWELRGAATSVQLPLCLFEGGQDVLSLATSHLFVGYDCYGRGGCGRTRFFDLR
jgi:hypothetical protein